MDNNRFPKALRLLKRRQFLSLQTNAQKRQNKHFIIRFRQTLKHHHRLGITVSKRVGKAVARNRIKRHIREYFRNNKRNISGSLDVNLIVKQPAAILRSQQIKQSLDGLFKEFAR